MALLAGPCEWRSGAQRVPGRSPTPLLMLRGQGRRILRRRQLAHAPHSLGDAAVRLEQAGVQASLVPGRLKNEQSMQMV